MKGALVRKQMLQEEEQITAIDIRRGVDDAAAANPPDAEDKPRKESITEAASPARAQEDEGTAAVSVQRGANYIAADGSRKEKEKTTEETETRKVAAGETEAAAVDNAKDVDRTPTRTTQLCTYSASQNAPLRCFTHATRVAQDCMQCLVKSFVIHAQCLTCCRTCYRMLLHDLSHLHHLFSDIFSLTDLFCLGPFWIGSRTPAVFKAEWRIH